MEDESGSGAQVTKKRSGGIGDALGHCRGGFNKGQGTFS